MKIIRNISGALITVFFTAVLSACVYAAVPTLNYSFVGECAPGSKYYVYFLINDAEIYAPGYEGRHVQPSSSHTVRKNGISISTDISDRISFQGRTVNPKYSAADLTKKKFADGVTFSCSYKKGRLYANVTVENPIEALTGIAFVSYEKVSTVNDYYHLIDTQQDISDLVDETLHPEKKEEESKAAEEKEKAEESKAAEEKKKAEESKAAEEKKKAEESKAAEEKKKAEESKAAEENKSEIQKKSEDIKNGISDRSSDTKYIPDTYPPCRKGVN